MGEKWKAIKTTILGVISIVVAALVLFGVIPVDQQAELSANAISVVDAIGAGIIAISGIINIFRAD